MKKFFFSACLLATFAIGFTASDEDLNISSDVVDTTGIPEDSKADPNPVVTTTTTNIPNISTSFDDVNGTIVMRIDMTGVKNPTDIEWLRLYGTGLSNQNVWVEIDGKPKGIDVYNTADLMDDHEVMTDIVFTVDNSGSMDQEANAIARDIIEYAKLLAESHLNARFGIVGYGGYISGAMDLTEIGPFSDYLNTGNGVNRTMHFGGDNATDLQAKADSWPATYGYWGKDVSDNECGASAIEFANEYFAFRPAANRIYINFTDEPNQPNGIEKYSVKFFESQANWPAAQGTVHTVFSAAKREYSNWNYSESPWLISDYTGGTTLFINSNASDLNLSTLPVTGAMTNSYIIRLRDVADLINDGLTHEVHITIVSEDETVVADKTFLVEFVM